MSHDNASNGSAISITFMSIAAVAGLAALIWFVVVPMTHNQIEQAEPASSEAIKAASAGSNCMRRELERMIQGGEVVTNGTLEKLALPCKLNDEQIGALSN